MRGLILETLFSDNDALISQDAEIEMTFQDTSICFLQIHIPLALVPRDKGEDDDGFKPIPSDSVEWGRWPIGKGGSSSRPEVIKSKSVDVPYPYKYYMQTSTRQAISPFSLFSCFRFAIRYSVMYFLFFFFFFFFLSSIEGRAETANALNDDDF